MSSKINEFKLLARFQYFLSSKSLDENVLHIQDWRSVYKFRMVTILQNLNEDALRQHKSRYYQHTEYSTTIAVISINRVERIIFGLCTLGSSERC